MKLFQMGLELSGQGADNVVVTRWELMVTCVMETRDSVTADLVSLAWSVINANLCTMGSHIRGVRSVAATPLDLSLNNVMTAMGTAGDKLFLSTI